MVAGKKQSDPFEIMLGPTFEVPAFGTGEVAHILEMPIWRLQKFLDVKSYPLSPAAQIGGRRAFSTADVCRIANANRLLRDGFAPKLVVTALQYIEDEDLLAVLDEKGDELARGGIYFKRGKEGPEMHFFAARPQRSQWTGRSTTCLISIGCLARLSSGSKRCWKKGEAIRMTETLTLEESLEILRRAWYPCRILAHSVA